MGTLMAPRNQHSLGNMLVGPLQLKGCGFPAFLELLGLLAPCGRPALVMYICAQKLAAREAYFLFFLWSLYYNLLSKPRKVLGIWVNSYPHKADILA